MQKVSIGIDVSDIQQAKSFYVDALGCEHMGDPYPKRMVLSAGDIKIWLLEKPAGTDPLPGGGANRSYKRHWTPVHLDFYVDDFDATLKRILSCHGLHEKVEKGQYAFCADPFGNGFCLVQNK